PAPRQIPRPRRPRLQPSPPRRATHLQPTLHPHPSQNRPHQSRPDRMKRIHSGAARHNSACPNFISLPAMSPHPSQNPPASPLQHKSSPPARRDPPTPSSAPPPSHTPSATTAPASPRGTAPQNPSQTSPPYPL